jgi:hypothetical protein
MNRRLLELMAVPLVGLSVASVVAIAAIETRDIWLDRAVMTDAVAIPLLALTILMDAIHAQYMKRPLPLFLATMLGTANTIGFVGFVFLVCHISTTAGTLLAASAIACVVTLVFYHYLHLRPFIRNLSSGDGRPDGAAGQVAAG